MPLSGCSCYFRHRSLSFSGIFYSTGFHNTMLCSPIKTDEVSPPTCSLFGRKRKALILFPIHHSLPQWVIVLYKCLADDANWLACAFWSQAAWPLILALPLASVCVRKRPCFLLLFLIWVDNRDKIKVIYLRLAHFPWQSCL